MGLGCPEASYALCVNAAQPGVWPQRSQHSSGLPVGAFEMSLPKQSCPPESEHCPLGEGPGPGAGPGAGPGLQQQAKQQEPSSLPQPDGAQEQSQSQPPRPAHVALSQGFAVAAPAPSTNSTAATRVAIGRTAGIVFQCFLSAARWVYTAWRTARRLEIF